MKRNNQHEKVDNFIGAYLTGSERQALGLIAFGEGRSLAQIIRRAIQQFIKRRMRPDAPRRQP